MLKQDAVVSSGQLIAVWKLFRTPTDNQECEQSIVSWLKAIKEVITLVPFSHSQVCCYLI